MSFQLKYLLWLPAIFMMVMIFYFSSKESKASSELSSDFTIKIIEISNEISNIEMTLEEKEKKALDLELYIRKAAHFFEFAILSICYGIVLTGIYQIKNGTLYPIALVCTIIYACTDEFHQIFVDGRSPQLTDVLIDSGGGMFGLLLFSIFLSYKKLYQKKLQKK